MSYNPNWPQDGDKLDADKLRAQWNGLKTIIDGLPAGPAGRGIANIRFNPDYTITIEMTDGTSHGPFPLPAGPAGADSNVPGPTGPTGADGRGIASVYDDGYGRAMIQLSDGSTYGSFTIASGNPGPQGNPGSDGRSVTNIRDTGSGSFMVDMSDGSSYGPFSPPAGQQGPPGEVSNQQLSDTVNTAINGTPRNVDGFSQLYITISDPPTQSEMQQILDSHNALILALRRFV